MSCHLRPSSSPRRRPVDRADYGHSPSGAVPIRVVGRFVGKLLVGREDAADLLGGQGLCLDVVERRCVDKFEWIVGYAPPLPRLLEHQTQERQMVPDGLRRQALGELPAHVVLERLRGTRELLEVFVAKPDAKMVVQRRPVVDQR